MTLLFIHTRAARLAAKQKKHWLKANQIDFKERHLFRETPTLDELKKKILSLTTEGMDEILATRSQAFFKA
ncbi:hypothetical protein BsIDN1_43220 [Bacillus safensis]|uniref:Uncharacterized protein n=1 Tax=Bacillus safensis TaxID=561879 RepID=A0A5S9MEY7_BACIA|nr:hypothetical protein BsIDN1_43220 [Bacillus safensis]